MKQKKDNCTDLLSLVKQGNNKVGLYLCEVTTKQFVADVKCLASRSAVLRETIEDLTGLLQEMGERDEAD